MINKKNMIKVTYYMPEELIHDLKLAARMEEISMGLVIRSAIKEYIKKYKRTKDGEK